MKLIDIHTHIYPDEIAKKATESVRLFYGIDTGCTMEGSFYDVVSAKFKKA